MGRLGLFRRFGAWLERRGWRARQAWFTGLAGIAVGFYTIDSAAQSSGADRVVAAVVGVLCILVGVAFAAAVLIQRRDQPKSSRVRVSDGSLRWPQRRRTSPPDDH
jgi:peptidoglycan/LPS O-acetylase OafA/YrhL